MLGVVTDISHTLRLFASVALPFDSIHTAGGAQRFARPSAMSTTGLLKKRTGYGYPGMHWCRDVSYRYRSPGGRRCIDLPGGTR
jgi:hypothetical protein